MYVQVGILALVGDHSTVPLTQVSCNTVFSKSQNACKAGTLCRRKRKPKEVDETHLISESIEMISLHKENNRLGFILEVHFLNSTLQV